MAMVSADLYEATGEASYLTWSRRIYAWTKENLQDPEDYVYFDNVSLDGSVDRRKYTYNTGCMLSAASALYAQTGEEAYLTDAQNIASGADAYFLEEWDGRYYLSGNAGEHTWFLSWLNEGFQRLYALDRNPAYLNHMTSAAMGALEATDESGYIYPGWRPGSGNTDELILQCGTIRILMELDTWNRQQAETAQ